MKIPSRLRTVKRISRWRCLRIWMSRDEIKIIYERIFTEAIVRDFPNIRTLINAHSREFSKACFLNDNRNIYGFSVREAQKNV